MSLKIETQCENSILNVPLCEDYYFNAVSQALTFVIFIWGITNNNITSQNEGRIHIPKLNNSRL